MHKAFVSSLHVSYYIMAKIVLSLLAGYALIMHTKYHSYNHKLISHKCQGQLLITRQVLQCISYHSLDVRESLSDRFHRLRVV